MAVRKDTPATWQVVELKTSSTCNVVVVRQNHVRDLPGFGDDLQTTRHDSDGIFRDLSAVVATDGSGSGVARDGVVATTRVLYTRGKMGTNLTGFHVRHCKTEQLITL